MSVVTPNVVHVTSWLSRQGGGIPPVIWNLAQHADRSEFSCLVAGLQDFWLETDRPTPSLPCVTGTLKGASAFGFASGLTSQVAARLNHASVIHAHGLWMHAGVMAQRCARRARCPRVVSPHGMLEPWALRNSRWKKRLAAWLFENKNLRSADCLHALCSAEAENFRRYGLRNPIAIIPNGVSLADLARPRLPSQNLSRAELAGSDQKILLFLSRLHPKKGLENLLQAWQTLAADFSDWRLVIAGAGDAAYETKLKSLVQTLHLSSRVVFIGPVYGAAKSELLAASAAFVLPSYSEGFSMAVLEAAAAGLPIMLTPECNFPELVGARAALETAPEIHAIAAQLRKLLKLSTAEREAMGARGRALIERHYTWPVLSAQMCQVYQWLLGRTARPDCVRLD